MNERKLIQQQAIALLRGHIDYIHDVQKELDKSNNIFTWFSRQIKILSLYRTTAVDFDKWQWLLNSNLFKE